MPYAYILLSELRGMHRDLHRVICTQPLLHSAQGQL